MMIVYHCKLCGRFVWDLFDFEYYDGDDPRGSSLEACYKCLGEKLESLGDYISLKLAPPREEMPDEKIFVFPDEAIDVY